MSAEHTPCSPELSSPEYQEWQGQKLEYIVLEMRIFNLDGDYDHDDACRPERYFINRRFGARSGWFSSQKSEFQEDPLAKIYSSKFKERTEEIGGFGPAEALRVLGEDGWDLVGFVKTYALRYILKRPISSSK